MPPKSRLQYRLKPIQKHSKPTTDLQRRLVARREKDRLHTQQSLPRIRARLREQDEEEVPQPADPENLPQELEDFDDLDHEHVAPPIDHMYDHQDEAETSDDDAQSEDPLINAMAQAHHQASRLKAELRWSHQHSLMLPVYLRNQLRTSDWGHRDLWNHDYKAACDCTPREGEVALIDVLDRRTTFVNFCDCQSDPVRLLEMGYIGCTPVHPKTAFSLRLLRLHHTLWTQSAMSTTGFASALEDFLDAYCPPLTVAGSQKPRNLAPQLSAAVKAYRGLLLLVAELERDKLQLDPQDLLAANCPRCFGPTVSPTKPEEPDVIVCLDGNFQHRRHAAASVPIPGYNPPLPSLFVDPALVEAMYQSMTTHREYAGQDDELHPCTESHTAANDVRGSSHWGGCDETGLLGMACRHDHVIRFINIVQSGEKCVMTFAGFHTLPSFSKDSGGDDTCKVGVLYDIGCTVEKGIIKRDQFADVREKGRLKFGTSVFHSYAHDWGCQLAYNPRLNEGWGQADGEGAERVWSDMDPLVPGNRYCTKQNRLVRIELSANYRNYRLKVKAVTSMMSRLKEARRRLDESKCCLNRLSRVSPDYTEGYFSDQWNRQKEMQQVAISTSLAEKRDKLSVLLELEEGLLSARDQLQKLRAKRARTRTIAEQRELLQLPRSLAILEERIHDVAGELGSQEFLQLTDMADQRAKPLITIQLAKANLYNAKVGVIEHQIWSHTVTGTSQQQRIKELGRKKRAALITKYNTYHRHAENYNTIHRPTPRIEVPTLGEIESMLITDGFWDSGALTHPDEPWATSDNVRTGIQAMLTKRRAEEELRRVAREARQLAKWAVAYQAKVDATKPHPLAEKYAEYLALHRGLHRKSSALWTRWDGLLQELMNTTAGYLTNSADIDQPLKTQWAQMVERCSVQGFI